jgi:L-ascorbate oxidase
VIDAGIINCPIQFSIENHDLLIIASDGHPIKPIKTNAIHLKAGMRLHIIKKLAGMKQ